MSETYFYRVFGLVLVSALPIPRLGECVEQQAQVQICELPADHDFELGSFASSFANWKASPQRFLLSVENVADFHVCDGNRIEIRPARGAVQEDIAAFLMGSAFAVLLQQRGFLTLHASAIRSAGGAVLFAGNSGVGKSTALAAMCDRGFEMITDDVAAIDFGENGTPRITPSFPGGKLTARSLAQLGKDADEFHMLRAEIEKFDYPLRLTGHSTSAIDRIVVLEAWEKPDLEVKLLTRSEAFQLVSFFTFRKRFYDGMGLQKFHFDAVSGLVDAVPVYRIRRPNSSFLLEELVETIASDLHVPTAGEATG